MMNTLKTIVLASGFWRLKAPRWHLGALWVSDVRAGKVFRIDLDGKVTIVADVPGRPFGLGFLPDGDLLVASMTQRLILKFGAEKPAIHADMADVAVGIPTGHGRRSRWKRLCDFFRRRCLRTRTASRRLGFFWQRRTAISDQLPTTSRIRTDWRSQVRMTCWSRKRSAIGVSPSRSEMTEHCCIERFSQTSRG